MATFGNRKEQNNKAIAVKPEKPSQQVNSSNVLLFIDFIDKIKNIWNKIDWHSRKTWLATAVIVIMIIGGGLFIHSRYAAPMTDYPISANKFADSRSSGDLQKDENVGKTASSQKGRHIPDGFH